MEESEDGEVKAKRACVSVSAAASCFLLVAERQREQLAARRLLGARFTAH